MIGLRNTINESKDEALYGDVKAMEEGAELKSNGVGLKWLG